MRNKASGLLKQVNTGLAAMAKAKTLAIKSKTKAIKTRLVIFSLFQNRKLLVSSFSYKLKALMGRNEKISDEVEGDHVSGDQRSPLIVLYNSSNAAMWIPSTSQTNYEDEEEKYPDPSHSLFDSEEMELADSGASVIEMVKNSKEGRGEEFRLEDEIDRVADLFIKRFHCQMRLQKQLSLKRRQETMGTSP
ncbi:P-loop containing nucleoside triphosphate hydrolases superfamily protein isoform 1 [Hibiscus syriacus]|uniref:P-loop containing nucleoside triphosphate hydrolases superfamily protein isoform 1 n=1 Tax=Hibiscus syriacus TaxID=106335 RepID=A0A6A3BMV2_HIBSY|nr:uncharacterized protein LOC120216106 [Hibiscus syriacus]KAE8716179.1 P-loop containing nucleoside triphosphate hydrolases superfamily protein isoform 1 [Hibiscus syriacus]